MHIVRYLPSNPGLGPRVGVLQEDGTLGRLNVRSIAELLGNSREDIRAATAEARPETSRFVLLPPVDGLTEVWAAGVTYRISREARVEESAIGDVYDRVYDADRPEIFFKSVAWRVVGDDEPIGISLMHRSFPDLVDYLFRASSFPEGAVLLTGTGLVPGMEFSLRESDTVRVSIDEVGVLTNVVAVGADSFDWLAESVKDPGARPRRRTESSS